MGERPTTGRAWLAALVVTILWLGLAVFAAGLLAAGLGLSAWALVPSYGVLGFGVLVTSAAARRFGIPRHDAIAAALLGIAAIPFVGYVVWIAWMWPAFAANRLDFGFDITHSPAWLLAGVAAASAILGLAVSRGLGRSTPRDGGAGQKLIALFGVAGALALGLALVLTMRERKHPAGYLDELERIAVDELGEGQRKIADLCFYREDSRAIYIVQKPGEVTHGARKPFGYVRAGDDDDTIHLLRAASSGVDPVVRRSLYRTLRFEEGVERNISYAFVPPFGTSACPSRGTTLLDPGIVLLHDGSHEVWYRQHEAGSKWYSQIVGPRGYVTLREVGAAPPAAVVRLSWLAVGLAAILGVAFAVTRRGDGAPAARAVLVIGTALVMTVASPGLVFTLVFAFAK